MAEAKCGCYVVAEPVLFLCTDGGETECALKPAEAR